MASPSASVDAGIVQDPSSNVSAAEPASLTQDGAAAAVSTPEKPKQKAASKGPRKPKVPPGYKLVKIMDRNGNVITARKKLTDAELAAEGETRGEGGEGE